MANLYITAGSGISLVESTSASTITVNNLHENRKCVVIPLNSTSALTGTEMNYVRIPSIMNGWNLSEVAASCSASSTSGSPTFTVKSGSQSMLTTNLMIDEGEFDSTTSGVPAVIDIDYDNVATGTKVWVASSGSSNCGTGVTWVEISLTFVKP